MSQTDEWEIRGANSQTIFGTTYTPDGPPAGCAIIAHGFKGYKDFRMIPAFARGLCRAGFVCARVQLQPQRHDRKVRHV